MANSIKPSEEKQKDYSKWRHLQFKQDPMRTLKTRMRKNATTPENPIWIIVRVIGYGKLKYFVERTHCKWTKSKVIFIIQYLKQTQDKTKRAEKTECLTLLYKITPDESNM